MDIIERAREYAIKHHNGQKQKSSSIPPTTHLQDVFNKLVLIGVDDKNILATAWLHDLVEDTDVTIEQIWVDFDEPVVSYVHDLTWVKEGSKKESKESYMNRIRRLDDDLQQVKLADVWHNSLSLESLSNPKRKRFINEIETFYIPLAIKIDSALEDDLRRSLDEYTRREIKRKSYHSRRKNWDKYPCSLCK